jgi:hypothetical protein
MLKEQGEVVNLATARLEDRAAIQRDLLQYKPKYVLNVAGMVRCANLFIMSGRMLTPLRFKTGRPNVDWCEDNKQQTTRYPVPFSSFRLTKDLSPFFITRVLTLGCA